MSAETKRAEGRQDRNRRKRVRLWILLFAVFLPVVLSGTALYIFAGKRAVIEQYDSVNRPAKIHPDYSDIVIPANIAPMNFKVEEKGLKYFVRIHSQQGEPIEVVSRTGKTEISQSRWRRLCEMNRGRDLYFDIFVKDDGGRWKRFAAITNRIAGEDIDGYLVYRKMHPTHLLYNGDLGVYQRRICNYDESLVLGRRFFKNGCLNCHTFCGNDANTIFLSIRSDRYGASTLLLKDGVVGRIGTKFGYSSWHPSGRLVVYTISRTPLFFHTASNEVRDTVNMDSALVYYVVGSKQVKTSPQIADKSQLETWPRWSPDGRWLYFCSAKMLWSDKNRFPPEQYDKVKYDIVRVSYNLDRDEWGERETVISAEDTGQSSLVPRISPDGRWLIFCMCEHGSFPAWKPDSDFYIVDLEAGRENGKYKYRRLDINSDQSESWCTWSSDSRWIVFSSKRGNPTFTRPYISYVDKNGKVYKPFVLPQKDPLFYDSCLKTYNTFELVTGPVAVTGERLTRVIRGSRQITVDLPITMATPRAGSFYGRQKTSRQAE